jgi:CheY-specific phosphatase CheX
MLVEDPELASKVADMAAGACVELFAAYGVALEPGGLASIDSDETLLSGVIGFVGPEVRGTCLLVGSKAPIEDSSPKKGRTRDWVGELTNQLVGRLKSKFVRRGLDVALTTPVVLSGVRLRPLPRANLEPRVFTAKAGAVMVWVEVEAGRGFSIESSEEDAAATEGEIVLF